MLIALHKGKGFISRLISWQTRGDYTHASVIIDENLLTVIEAREFQGVQMSNLHNRKETIDIYEIPTTRSEDEQIGTWLRSQIGKGYDYLMVLRFVSRRKESDDTTGKWFCSELAFAAFIKAGIKLLERTQPWEVSPNLLSRAPRLRFVMRINPQQSGAEKTNQPEYSYEN